jgi:non-ribosomal peptide synthetase-like protein
MTLAVDTQASTVDPDRCASATTGIERALASVLADALEVERVPLDSHFFDDLGADSLVMAHVCARLRKRGDVTAISMKDVYAHPTVSTLATALANATPAARSQVPIESATAATTRQYVVCGALQILCFLAYVYVTTLGFVWAYAWITAGAGGADIYVRLVLAGVVGLVAVCVFPIAAKWTLIGRWKPERIPLWSLAYVRFWIVKTSMRANPVALLFVGSPLYALYLRALGARIGPGVAIFSRRLPVCTDLLTVGAGSVIRRESFFLCYRAHDGWIETGAVTLGRDVFVGERTVLDIGTSMGDGAQLGHASALHSGQAVPTGQRWHGSPAERTDVDYLTVPPATCGALRRFRFSVVTLLLVFLLYLPFAGSGVYFVTTIAPSLAELLDPAAGIGVLTWSALLVDAVVVAVLACLGRVLVALLVVGTVPRLLNALIEPYRVYPLYGFHHRVHRLLTTMTNRAFLVHLFGDSSYIVHYLSWLGYRLSPVEQTGSNFGLEVSHANPFLCSVGTGTMAADGLAIINDEVSSTSFRATPAAIGRHNFVGNDVAYPAGARTGENCLLATKAMMPLDGEVRHGVGLLGSPCFEIPRSVDRDSRLAHVRTAEERSRRLPAKNRYNLQSIGLYVLLWSSSAFLVAFLVLATNQLVGPHAPLVVPAVCALSLVVMALYAALVERCIGRFRPLQPAYCSIYDPQFWLYERLWKVTPGELLGAFDGTPFKSLFWRLMGVRVGKRVFDDGVHISERTLTTLGDACTLNAGSKIMCHSQEDAAFKSDRTAIGAGCTVGVGAFVHYGVTTGDGSTLAPDSFLMKGEQVPAHARWGGNPAREM